MTPPSAAARIASATNNGQRAVLSPRTVLDVTGAYDAHLKAEEAELIPLAADVLTPDELRAIGREMATRRGVAASARAPA